MSAIILIFVSILLAVSGQFLLKKGMNKIGNVNLSEVGSVLIKVMSNGYILTALVVFCVAFFLWLLVLSKFDLSFAYPLVSIGYILVALVSFVFLKENLSLMRWVGIILIAVGSFVVTRT